MYNGNHTHDNDGVLILTEREKVLMQVAFGAGYEYGHDAILEKTYEQMKGYVLSITWINESIENCHLEEEINRISQ